MTDPGQLIADAFPGRPLVPADLEAIEESTPSSLELEIASEIETADGIHNGITVIIATGRSLEITKVFGYQPAAEEWVYLEELDVDPTAEEIDRLVTAWDQRVSSEMETS